MFVLNVKKNFLGFLPTKSAMVSLYIVVINAEVLLKYGEKNTLVRIIQITKDTKLPLEGML